MKMQYIENYILGYINLTGIKYKTSNTVVFTNSMVVIIVTTIALTTYLYKHPQKDMNNINIC